MQLAKYNIVTTVATKDLKRAKEFFGQTLGLKQQDENPAGVTFGSGGSDLFVYVSDTAGSSKATCANWNVEDISTVVKELKDKGVAFEKYDISGATQEGDVSVMGNMKAAWFKDPDGNIFGISQM